MDAKVFMNAVSRDFPDVYQMVSEKIRSLAPAYASTGDSYAIAESYCSLHGITRKELQRSAYHRKMVLALCMLKLDKARLLDLKDKLNNGILPGISMFCGCNKSSLADHVTTIISNYKTNFGGFRDDLDALGRRLTKN